MNFPDTNLKNNVVEWVESKSKELINHTTSAQQVEK